MGAQTTQANFAAINKSLKDMQVILNAILQKVTAPQSEAGGSKS
jgi:hypothetical protein